MSRGRGPLDPAAPQPPTAGHWHTISLGGRSIAIPADPLCAAAVADPANRLLAEHAALRPGDQVLILGVGCGLLAAWAAARIAPGRLILSDAHSGALERAAATLDRNNQRRYELLPSDRLSDLAAGVLDAALVDIAFQSSSSALVAALHAAGRALKPGGRLYVAGAKARGIGAVKARAAAIFGAAATLGYRKGVHVVVATRPADWDAAIALTHAATLSPALGDRAAEGQSQQITLRGQTFRIERRDGVFARGGLDDGTRMLLDAVVVRHDDCALDLGCGGGIIGMLLARLAPAGYVDLVDSDTAAVALARDNLHANGITNATAHVGDGLSAVPGATYDLIVTNPPFHVGRRQTSAVARGFIAGAADALRSSGRFYVVTNRFLAYEHDLAAAFGNVREVAGDGRYKVLLATRNG